MELSEITYANNSFQTKQIMISGEAIRGPDPEKS